MGVTFKAEVRAESQYYGAVEIKGIAQDGDEMKVQKHLKVNLILPAAGSGTDVNLLLTPWIPIDVSVENNQIGSDKFEVTLTMASETPFAVGPSATLTIGVNGDLTGDAAKPCLDSIKISADD
ncbi:hypothetical protein ACIOGZ_32380 [Kitasatospora sp. NPDC088160]|uniref:hypothetical protein n=1 Tax=Kitasatospora sp. NPDC088160 TaxID=3364072 RepID=UPI00380A70C9